MDDSIVTRFFTPIKQVAYDKVLMDSDKLGYVTQLLDSIGDILPHNSYIVDYHKKNFFFISRSKHKFCSKYDVASVFDDAGTVDVAVLFFFQFPDLTFSCEYSDILYNILHLSAVGSRVHTDAAA